MERTETLVLGVTPERRQNEVRKRKAFGWVLGTAHEEAVLKAGETRKEIKLVLTRTGSEQRLGQLKQLEEEWDTLMKSVVLDERGRIIADRRPVEGLPWPFIISQALVVGGLIWALTNVIVGVVATLASGSIAFFMYQRRADTAMALYSTRVDAATVAFHRRQKDILTRARAAVNAREN